MGKEAAIRKLCFGILGMKYFSESPLLSPSYKIINCHSEEKRGISWIQQRNNIEKDCISRHYCDISLERRCYEHKQKKIKGFTQKYNVDKLIYFERFDSVDSAIAREKQIKGFSREKKLALINKVNNEWKELSYTGLFKTRL